MSAVPETIKAAYRTVHESVELQVGDLKKSFIFGKTLGKENEVLSKNDVVLKMISSSVNPVDFKIMNGMVPLPKWLKPLPCVPGLDFSGEVIATGSNVNHVKTGDKVFGVSDLFRKNGTWATYASVPGEHCVKIPEGLDAKTAGCVSLVALTSLQSIKKLNLKKGSKVLILGGATSTGMYGISFAKKFGYEVIATCSPRSFALVKKLGADTIINYRETSFHESDAYDKVDGIYDCFGEANAFDNCHERLVDGGSFVSIAEYAHEKLGFYGMLRMHAINAKRNIKSFFGKKHSYTWLLMKANRAELQEIATMWSEDEVTPIIDGFTKLEDVNEAVEKVISGKVQGKAGIVIDEMME